MEVSVKKGGDVMTAVSVTFFLCLCPTTHRYIGLSSFFSPPSSPKGFCTFTIQSRRYDFILLSHVLYDIYLAARYDLAHPLV